MPGVCDRSSAALDKEDESLHNGAVRPPRSPWKPTPPDWCEAAILGGQLRLVLTSHGGSIVTIDLNGEVLQRVTEPDASLFGPAWSPEGKSISYSRGTTGPHADIFTSRPDGTDAQQVTSTAANEITVEWSPGKR